MNNWYTNWHKNPKHVLVHWLIFILVCAGLSTMVYSVGTREVSFGLSTSQADKGKPVPKVPVAKRAEKAEKIVVGTVTSTTTYKGTNDYGDNLIFTKATVAVEDTLKGDHSSSVDVNIEGGTLNGISLVVSDMPTIQKGDKAVFFLKHDKKGNLVPHMRGEGIMKLDKNNINKKESMASSDGQINVDGEDDTDLSLDEIKAQVTNAQ